MATSAETKIPITIQATTRQVNFLQAEAVRTGLSFAEVARRALDWFIDDRSRVK
jgi:hypothetical protein